MGLIAVIPARGGSKRIPRKNVKLLHGLPMIAYTIQAALESGLFDRVLVSTDDPEIAEISKSHGADVPFLRCEGLSDDHTPVSLVTLDAIDRLDPGGTDYRAVAQLMPNCPLRNREDVLESHRQFSETRATTQVSVTRFGWQNPWWAFKRAEDLSLQPLFEAQLKQRSQDLPPLFCPTGAIWWAQCRALRSHRTFHSADRTGWEIAWEHGVDIDTEEDWRMAEFLLGSVNAH